MGIPSWFSHIGGLQKRRSGCIIESLMENPSILNKIAKEMNCLISDQKHFTLTQPIVPSAF